MGPRHTPGRPRGPKHLPGANRPPKGDLHAREVQERPDAGRGPHKHRVSVDGAALTPGHVDPRDHAPFRRDDLNANGGGEGEPVVAGPTVGGRVPPPGSGEGDFP